MDDATGNAIARSGPVRGPAIAADPIDFVEASLCRARTGDAARSGLGRITARVLLRRARAHF